MNPNDPLISVIMPVFNGEDFLEEAIDNIRKQWYQPLEIIIVDDGSEDETATVAAQFEKEVRYVYQSNKGPAAARNTALKIAMGELVAFLDVDDLWAENRLTTQSDFLKAHPDVEIVQGLIQDLQAVKKTGDATVFKAVSDPYFSVNLGAALYRKKVFDKVGFFDETLRYNEDTDWFIQAWDNHIKKAKLDEVALYYRKHDKNMTNVDHAQRSGFTWLLKRRLDRHRKIGDLLEKTSPDQSENITEYMGWG